MIMLRLTQEGIKIRCRPLRASQKVEQDKSTAALF